MLEWGEPAPYFGAAAPVNPKFDFSSLAGRFVVLVFFGHSGITEARKALAEIAENVRARDDQTAVIFGVSARKEDFSDPLVLKAFPPNRIFFDENWEIARKYGVLQTDSDGRQGGLSPTWFILDPTLRLYSRGTLMHVDRLAHEVGKLPDPQYHGGQQRGSFAPVLVVPRVLTRSLCQKMIDYYNQGNARESGFMRNIDGKTVGIKDASFKRRKDVDIEDEELRRGLRLSLVRRLLPEIKKSFQFEATRIERYIVACYDSQTQGFFRAHRDNTTPGTAHRRFAVTINLNADEFEGGELRFPEFGPRTYKAPTGGAVVFSCSLLHEALPVTAGTRYATLPFLYGTADAELRAKNLSNIVPSKSSESDIEVNQP
ncbi:2OG-Fe(II) oxygenase [Kordiimonas sp.]|uniref:2OG-Fe(II) oxygenase n=1 Tax=Kordiimonas sp. TaxID=1970157 RepID=UPI003A8DACA7